MLDDTEDLFKYQLIIFSFRDIYVYCELFLLLVPECEPPL